MLVRTWIEPFKYGFSVRYDGFIPLTVSVLIEIPKEFHTYGGRFPILAPATVTG